MCVCVCVCVCACLSVLVHFVEERMYVCVVHFCVCAGNYLHMVHRCKSNSSAWFIVHISDHTLACNWFSARYCT